MFEDALEITLRHEGGYVWHASDPGGETNYGITKRVAEEHDYHGEMREIPMGLVRHIYRVSYWNKIKADQMTWPVALVTFDAAVNSGVGRASRWLQTALEVRPIDGVIGEQTLAAVREADPDEIAKVFSDMRLSYLKSLGTWRVFGKGWEIRVKDVLREALT